MFSSDGFPGLGHPQIDGGFSVAVLTIDSDDEKTLTDALPSSDIYTKRDDVGRTINDEIGASFAPGFAHGPWVFAQGKSRSDEHAGSSRTWR